MLFDVRLTETADGHNAAESDDSHVHALLGEAGFVPDSDEDPRQALPERVRSTPPRSAPASGRTGGRP